MCSKKGVSVCADVIHDQHSKCSQSALKSHVLQKKNHSNKMDLRDRKPMFVCSPLDSIRSAWITFLKRLCLFHRRRNGLIICPTSRLSIASHLHRQIKPTVEFCKKPPATSHFPLMHYSTRPYQDRICSHIKVALQNGQVTLFEFITSVGSRSKN